MGVLDKLMFWKDDAATDAESSASSEHKVAGCFTLPIDQSSDDTPQPDCAEPAGND